METVNIHQAKTHLSRLVARVARGESFVIAKAGRPMAKVVPIEPGEPKAAKRTGFLPGAFKVPDDFDNLGREAIEALFGGKT